MPIFWCYAALLIRSRDYISNAIINLYAALKLPCGQVTGNKESTIGGGRPNL